MNGLEENPLGRFSMAAAISHMTSSLLLYICFPVQSFFPHMVYLLG